MRKMIDTILTILLVGTTVWLMSLGCIKLAHGTEVYQGYFLTTIEQIEHIQNIKEVVGYNTVDVLDEEGQPTGETIQVPIYEWTPSSWFETRPALGESILNFQVVATYNDKVLVYIVTNRLALALRLKDRPEFLGQSIRAICVKAITNSTYRPIAKRLLYSLWDSGQVDESGNPVIKRGNMVEWIADGKPTLLHKWVPKLVYAGVANDFPDLTDEENVAINDVLTQ